MSVDENTTCIIYIHIDTLGDRNKQRNYYILFLPIKNYYSVCDTIKYTSKLQSLGLMILKVVSKNKILYIPTNVFV